MKLRNRELNVFSMSALDLFASALGAFIILAVVALPFFPNTSQLDDETLLEQIEAAERQRDELASELDSAQAENEQLTEVLQRVRVEDMDIVIVLDVTGSMRAVIDDLKVQINDLVQVLERMAPSLGVGVITYGDRRYEDVTVVQRIVDLGVPARRRELDAFVESISLRMGIGSGSNPEAPEAIHTAMEVALGMNWRRESRERYLVFITDAPAYPEQRQGVIDNVRRFASSPGHFVSAVQVDGSMLEETESLLTAMATEGNGQYVNREEGQSFIASMLLAVIRDRS